MNPLFPTKVEFAYNDKNNVNFFEAPTPYGKILTPNEKIFFATWCKTIFLKKCLQRTRSSKVENTNLKVEAGLRSRHRVLFPSTMSNSKECVWVH